MANIKQDGDPVVEPSDDLLEDVNLHTYKEMTSLYHIIFDNSTELNKEIEEIYRQLPRIELKTDTLLDILGLKEYYQQQTEGVDQNTADFQKIYREMDLINYEFYSSLKNLLNSVEIFRDFELYMLVLFDPHEEKFLADDPKNLIYKVDKGIDMLNQIFGLKMRVDYLIKQVQKGISQFFTVKGNMIYLINKFQPQKSGTWKLTARILLFLSLFLI